MLSQTGDYIGTKKKIEDSPAMKKHFEVDFHFYKVIYNVKFQL